MANESSFIASVDDWARAQEGRLTTIFRDSAQRVASIASNGVPVDTGFCRASVRASTSEMPQIDPAMQNKEGRTFPYDPGVINLIIAGAQLGEHIFIGWTAAYANALEYGHSKQAPQGFVRVAAAQWDSIVSEVIAEAKAQA
jgi:hypothetical protein